LVFSVAIFLKVDVFQISESRVVADSLIFQGGGISNTRTSCVCSQPIMLQLLCAELKKLFNSFGVSG